MPRPTSPVGATLVVALPRYRPTTVIPAKAGIQKGGEVHIINSEQLHPTVIPAKAGIQKGGEVHITNSEQLQPTVIPANAGI